jgi:capsular polysaccharide biosynthesis protein
VIRSLQQRIYDRTKSAIGAPEQAERAAQLMRRQESVASLADELRREVERQMQERGATIVPPKEDANDEVAP